MIHNSWFSKPKYLLLIFYSISLFTIQYLASSPGNVISITNNFFLFLFHVLKLFQSMSLIELNGLDNNSALGIMEKKIIVFGVLIGTHETLEYREKENIIFFFPLP